MAAVILCEWNGRLVLKLGPRCLYCDCVFGCLCCCCDDDFFLLFLIDLTVWDLFGCFKLLCFGVGMGITVKRRKGAGGRGASEEKKFVLKRGYFDLIAFVWICF